MNAIPPINLNPANAAQPAAPGKSQDAAADVPFRQVLSSEMAHQRNEKGSREKADIGPGPNDAGAAHAARPAEAGTPGQDIQQDQAILFPVMPEALLALAVPSDSPKAIAASASDAPASQPLSLNADALASGRRNRTAPLQAGPFTGQPADSREPGALPGDKTKLQTAMQAAAATDARTRTASPAAAIAAAMNAQAAAAADAKAQAVSPAAAFAAAMNAQAAAVTDAQAQAVSPAIAMAGQPAAATAAAATDARPQATSPAAAFAAAMNAQAAAAADAQAQTVSPAAAMTGQLAAAHQVDPLKARELPAELMGHAALHSTTQTSLHLPGTDPLASGKLAPAVGTSAWNQALGDRVVWMAAGAQQTASLTLNPPNMGPLQIVLNVTNDQATASFFSAQPEVRQALEAAFPKLREMMNDAGIQLGQATVSAENPRQNEPFERQAQWTATPLDVTGDEASIGQTAPHAAIQHSGRGLVDTFA